MPFPLIPVIAGVAGAAASYFGQRETNQVNADMSRESARFNQETAREQMAFQERMSNTSHAREVADLRAAGLNPILSANAGASAPVGASGSMQASQSENPFREIGKDIHATISAARESKLADNTLAQGKKQLEVLSAQAKKLRTEELLLRSDLPQRETKGELWDSIRDLVKGMGEVRASKERTNPAATKKAIEMRNKYDRRYTPVPLGVKP